MFLSTSNFSLKIDSSGEKNIQIREPLVNHFSSYKKRLNKHPSVRDQN